MPNTLSDGIATERSVTTGQMTQGLHKIERMCSRRFAFYFIEFYMVCNCGFWLSGPHKDSNARLLRMFATFGPRNDIASCTVVWWRVYFLATNIFWLGFEPRQFTTNKYVLTNTAKKTSISLSCRHCVFFFFGRNCHKNAVERSIVKYFLLIVFWANFLLFAKFFRQAKIRTQFFKNF